MTDSWAIVELVVQPSVRGLCRKPYPLHKHGCPNFDKKDGCPPQAPLIGETLDLTKPTWAVWNRFCVGNHVRLMRAKHPSWTLRQLYCVLYWQPKARKQLRCVIRQFVTAHRLRYGHMKVVGCPEAQGVNVTETMAGAGIVLEWPPMEWAYQVVIAGTAKAKENDS